MTLQRLHLTQSSTHFDTNEVTTNKAVLYFLMIYCVSGGDVAPEICQRYPANILTLSMPWPCPDRDTLYPDPDMNQPRIRLYPSQYHNNI